MNNVLYRVFLIGCLFLIATAVFVSMIVKTEAADDEVIIQNVPVRDEVSKQTPIFTFPDHPITVNQPFQVTFTGPSFTDYANSVVEIHVYPENGGVMLFDNLSLAQKKLGIVLFPIKEGHYTFVFAMGNGDFFYFDKEFDVRNTKVSELID